MVPSYCFSFTVTVSLSNGAMGLCLETMTLPKGKDQRSRPLRSGQGYASHRPYPLRGRRAPRPSSYRPPTPYPLGLRQSQRNGWNHSKQSHGGPCLFPLSRPPMILGQRRQPRCPEIRPVNHGKIQRRRDSLRSEDKSQDNETKKQIGDHNVRIASRKSSAPEVIHKEEDLVMRLRHVHLSTAGRA